MDKGPEDDAKRAARWAEGRIRARGGEHHHSGSKKGPISKAGCTGNKGQTPICGEEAGRCGPSICTWESTASARH